jgi:hypothetical protein
MYRKVQFTATDYTDYMFTNKNLIKYCKSMLDNDSDNEKSINIIQKNETQKKESSSSTTSQKQNNIVNKFYTPKQSDTLFWCFYILKYGYSNYEMEINGQYFTVEKQTKLKYVEQLKKFKDTLKLHKIKPYTEIEDDLANKDKIGIKTFFALCIIENINAIIIDKRKMYQLLCSDTHMSVLHKQNGEYSIETDTTLEIIKKYLHEYYLMSTYDSTLKSISSYTVDELINLCNKFGIKIENGKKLSKKDYYELLVMNF